jgi:hypothetical protein
VWIVGIAFAVALGACQETGSTTNPSTAGGTGGLSAGGAGGVGLAGFGGASGLGAAGTSIAGTGGAPTAGTGFAGIGAGGMQGAGGMLGTSGMGAGTGGMPGTSGMGAGTGGMSGTGGMRAGTGGMSGAGGQGGMGSTGPTFAPVYAIIMAKCGGGAAGCHVTGSSGGLRMPNAATAHDNLVGVASSQCAGEMRVVAGNADDSLIVQAIEGTACIDQMPDGRAPLTAGEIAMFRAWIDGGARE